MTLVVNTARFPIDLGGQFLAPGRAAELTAKQEENAKRGGHGRRVNKKPATPPKQGGGKGGKA